MSLEKELDKLEPLEVVDISEKIEDHIVSPEIAAKMKSISLGAIYDAIKRGKLRMVRGITLQSLINYKVNEKNRTSGKISQLKKLEKKVKELEKGDSNGKNSK